MKCLIEQLWILFEKSITSRKLVLTLTLIVFLAVGLWCGKVSDNIFLDAIKFFFGSYILVEGMNDAMANFKKSGTNEKE